MNYLYFSPLGPHFHPMIGMMISIIGMYLTAKRKTLSICAPTQFPIETN